MTWFRKTFFQKPMFRLHNIEYALMYTFPPQIDTKWKWCPEQNITEERACGWAEWGSTCSNFECVSLWQGIVPFTGSRSLVFVHAVVFFFLDSTWIYTNLNSPKSRRYLACKFVTGMRKTRRCIVAGMCTSGRIRYYEAWTSVWKRKKSRRHPEKESVDIWAFLLLKVHNLTQ